jgi:chromosome segregation ATPase
MREIKKPEPAEIQKYLNEGIRRLTEAPNTLNKNERRLLTKFKKVSDSAQSLSKDIQDLGNQIAQAQARKNSLELQVESLHGSINAYVDELVSLKYDAGDDAPAALEPEVISLEGEANA